MRVPVLITITFASGTTALLESVMRPVSDALVDCARTGVTEDKRTPTRTIARRAAGQDHLAMLKGKTKFKIIVSFPARLDRVHTYPAVIRISGLSRRQQNGRIRNSVYLKSSCEFVMLTITLDPSVKKPIKILFARDLFILVRRELYKFGELSGLESN